MPTYDYECPACEHTFGSRRLRRLIGAGAGILFRGSGFYQTDYRSEAYKAEAKAETARGTSSAASDGKAPGGKGSAEKPAAKNAGKADD